MRRMIRHEDFTLSPRTMVEVFKTNVTDQKQAAMFLKILSLHFPHHKVNFDLDDCDKILRVEGSCEIADDIRMIARDHGVVCDILE
jgi:hypothetical protein